MRKNKIKSRLIEALLKIFECLYYPRIPFFFISHYPNVYLRGVSARDLVRAFKSSCAIPLDPMQLLNRVRSLTASSLDFRCSGQSKRSPLLPSGPR